MYDFTKANRAPRAQRGSAEPKFLQFRHNKNLFLKDRPDLLPSIQRKAPEGSGRNNYQARPEDHVPPATCELKPAESGGFIPHDMRFAPQHTVEILQKTVVNLEEKVKELTRLFTTLFSLVEGSPELANALRDQVQRSDFRINSAETRSGPALSPMLAHAENVPSMGDSYPGPSNFSSVPMSTNSSTTTNYDGMSSQSFQNPSFAPSTISESYSQRGIDPQQYQLGQLDLTVNTNSGAQQSNTLNYGPGPSSQSQHNHMMSDNDNSHYPGNTLSSTGPSSPQHTLSSQPSLSSPISPRMRATSPPSHAGRPLAGGRSFATAAVPMAEPPPSSGYSLFGGSGA